MHCQGSENNQRCFGIWQRHPKISPPKPNHNKVSASHSLAALREPANTQLFCYRMVHPGVTAAYEQKLPGFSWLSVGAMRDYGSLVNILILLVATPGTIMLGRTPLLRKSYRMACDRPLSLKMRRLHLQVP
jgi:hypothetical protein